MSYFTLCAFLAPALVRAAAFPWAGPEPTLVVPEQDHWTPAPTEGPKPGGIELFRRAGGSNTCGFISGDTKSSITCANESFVCATENRFAVHGCCNPDNFTTCTLATTCIPSSALSASCTGTCTTDPMVARCTDSAKPHCYEHAYIYSPGNTMIEYGCASAASNLTLLASLPGTTTTTPTSDVQVPILTPSATSTSTSTSTSTNAESNKATGKRETPIGAIVGGVVGGLAVIGAVVGAVSCIMVRDRRMKRRVKEGEARDAAKKGAKGMVMKDGSVVGTVGVGSSPVAGHGGSPYVPQPQGRGVGGEYGYEYGYPNGSGYGYTNGYAGYASENEQVKAWQGVGAGSPPQMVHEGVGLGLGFGLGTQPLVVEAGGRPVERPKVYEVP